MRHPWVCRHLGTIAPFVVGGLLFASGCRRGLPTPPPDNDGELQTPVDTYGSSTGDTAVAGPCAAPEIEPNDGGTDATLIPLERVACGEFANSGDRDVFAFEFEDAGWVAIELEAADGSLADLKLAVDGPDGLRIDKFDDSESTDVTLKFNTQVGDYAVTVEEENNQGGERFTYELLVSEAKAPVEWTRLEAEPNNVTGQSETIPGSASIFGTIDGNAELADRDWFEIQIPGGEHDLRLDVDSFAFGAAGDIEIEVRDTDDNLLVSFDDTTEGGVQQRDPRGTYASAGDETVRIQVREESGQEGPAHWYVLHIELVEVQ